MKIQIEFHSNFYGDENADIKIRCLTIDHIFIDVSNIFEVFWNFMVMPFFPLPTTSACGLPIRPLDYFLRHEALLDKKPCNYTALSKLIFLLRPASRKNTLPLSLNIGIFFFDFVSNNIFINIQFITLKDVFRWKLLLLFFWWIICFLFNLSCWFI